MLLCKWKRVLRYWQTNLIVRCFLGLLGYFLDETRIPNSKRETSSQMPSPYLQKVISSLHTLSTHYLFILPIFYLSTLVYRPVNIISKNLPYQLPRSSTYGISTEYSWQARGNKLNLLQTQMAETNSFGTATY